VPVSTPIEQERITRVIWHLRFVSLEDYGCMSHARSLRGGCNPVTFLSLSLSFSVCHSFAFFYLLFYRQRDQIPLEVPHALLEDDPSGSDNETKSWSGEKTESTADALFSTCSVKTRTTFIHSVM